MGCYTHREHGVAGTCRSCTLEFCEECLVYAFGEGKQPYCIDCAVAASSRNTWDDRRRVGGRAQPPAQLGLARRGQVAALRPDTP